MKKLLFIICLYLFFLIYLPQSGLAGEPITYSAAENLKAENPAKAAALFNKYVKENPMAADAARAKYQEGILYEALGDYYKAYKAYQHIIENFPLYPNQDDLLDRQYRIGNYYLMIAKQSSGSFIGKIINPHQKRAIEIFKQVVENAPFTKIGAKAQYRLGYAYMETKQYLEAVTEFQIVIEKYPGSGYIDDAVYGLANSYFLLVQGPEYDQFSTEKALEYFNRYASEFPHGKNNADAQVKINKLKQNLAKGLFLIGEFYEKNKRYEAALIYYNEVESLFPDSYYSEKSRSKRPVLEGIVEALMPYKEIMRNYEDCIMLYYSIKVKDPRFPWEFWKKDPLTPKERKRLEWAEQLVKAAKSHKKEAEQLFKTEEKIKSFELKIRSLKDDIQHYKTQLKREEAVYEQLQNGVVSDEKQASEDSKIQDGLKRLQRKQRIKIRRLRKKIKSKEKEIIKLTAQFEQKQADFNANKQEYYAKRDALIEKAQKLRVEVDLLVAGSDEFALTDINDITLSDKKIKWKKANLKQTQQKKEEKPEVLRRLADEAAKEKKIIIPYENQLRGGSFDYWWKVLVGEKERVKTPSDAIQLYLK
ncbi:outer membrane protein assembly factor BamD [bacterium]|nr:outer membrane protein assembly factor BamD [bacterium]